MEENALCSFIFSVDKINNDVLLMLFKLQGFAEHLKQMDDVVSLSDKFKLWFNYSTIKCWVDIFGFVLFTSAPRSHAY